MLMINLSLVLLAFAEINAYICNAIRWGNGSFPYWLFQNKFLKNDYGNFKNDWNLTDNRKFKCKQQNAGRNQKIL